MSVVTNIIIFASLLEESADSCPAVEYLNTEFALPRAFRFVEVGRYSTGHKAMECLVFVAAVNHLDLREFGGALAATPWVDPETVQCFVKEQEDELFRPFGG